MTGLGDGEYELSVTQTDAAGNVGPAATAEWIVDTTAPAAPSITRFSPSGTPTTSTTQSISYGGEAGSTFECKVDSEPFAPCGISPLTLTGLSLGSHTLAVRQIDAAGNDSPTNSVEWTVVVPGSDGSPPPQPDPNEPPDDTPTLSAKLSSVSPKAITPGAHRRTVLAEVARECRILPRHAVRSCHRFLAA